MATNNNNGSNGNINYSSPANRNMGVTGNLQNRVAGQQFNERFYREKSGYLDSTANEIETILKGYKEIAKNVDSMSKVEQNRFKKQQEALEEQLKTLKYVKETREIDLEEAIKLIKESNKITVSGAKEHLRITRMIHEEQGLNDKKHREELDSIIEHYEKIKKTTSETNQDMKDTAKILANTSASFGKALSNSLKEAGDFAANLSNMLNLSSIANNAAEQNLRSKLSIQNSVMKQFGMGTTSQYNQFRQSARDTLWNMNRDMGALFSTDDMYKYFEKLDELGVTNQKIAEDQLQATIMGTKYLGVSDETQRLIFRFMKNTNSYDMLDKHNKTIAGLLKAQLGVSKEQLDALSQTVYSDADVLAALGGNAKAYTRTSIAAGAVVDSVSGNSGWGNSLTKTLGQLVTASPDELGNWAQIFGNEARTIQQLGRSGKADEAIRMMIDNDYLRNIINTGNEDFIAQLMKDYNIDSTLLNINKYFSGSSKLNEYDKKIVSSLEFISSMTDKELKNYVEDTSELTTLEKIENMLSFTKDTLDSWNGTFSLANIALAMYIASGAVQLFSGLSKFIGGFSNGGLLGGLKALLGGGGASGTAVSAGVGKLAAFVANPATLTTAITAGVLAGAHAWESKMNEGVASKALEDFKNSESKYANDTSAQSIRALTAAEGNKEGKNWFGRTIGDIGDAGQATWLGIRKLGSSIANLGVEDKYKTDSDYISKNKSYFESMFAPSIKVTGEEADQYTLAFAYLLDEVNSLASLDGVDRAFLKKYVKNGDFEANDIQGKINALISAGWSPSGYDTKKATGRNTIDRYLMAGLNYIPKDNFRALLHKGEMVLNAREAEAYREGYGMGGEGDSGLKALIRSPWVRVSSMWGSRKNPFGGNGNENHGGIDIAAPANTPVGSPISGTVFKTTTGYGGGFGNSVYISGKNGMNYILAHFVKPASVSAGASVSPGQIVGYVGSTGRSTGNHLHFQVNKSGTWNKANTVDPVPFLNSGVLYPGTVVESTNSTLSANGVLPTTTSPTTRRFINGSSNAVYSDAMGGEDEGATRIVSSVDGGFNKLIAYLDNIAQRQNEQQILLEAFSKSRTSGRDF